MIPTRWSSAIAILRRRDAEAAAEERLLRRSMVADGDGRRDDAPMATGGADDATATPLTERLAERLASLWKQLTRD